MDILFQTCHSFFSFFWKSRKPFLPWKIGNRQKRAREYGKRLIFEYLQKISIFLPIFGRRKFPRPFDGGTALWQRMPPE